MGNRAVIAFIDRNEMLPKVATYMHWNGGPESVYAMLDVMKEHKGFVHSSCYSTARFAHVACSLLGHDGLSVGIRAAADFETMASEGEDNGLYVYDISTGTMQRWVNPRGSDEPVKLTAEQVAAEEAEARKHGYWENDAIRNQLREAFPKD